VASVPFFLRESRYIFPRCLQTFNMAETNRSLKIAHSIWLKPTDPSKSHIQYGWNQPIPQNRTDVTSKFYEYSDTWKEKALRTGK
jgi:hypothetical protein